MGNTPVVAKENRMAIAAMANVMKITKKDMISLRDKCLKAAVTGEGDNPDMSTVSRSDFAIAMAEIGIAGTNLTPGGTGHDDGEIIDRLFTMFDKTGDERINHMSFLTGISPLCSLASANKKLLFAFRLFDVEKTGLLSSHDVILILTNINACASYFGDAVLSPDQIQELVFDIFRSNNIKGQIDYTKAGYVDQFIDHPLTTQFLAGQGTIRYGTK